MGTMAGILWNTSNNIAQIGEQYALSKERTSDMLMLSRYEKDFLLRKDSKYITKFENRMSSMNEHVNHRANGLRVYRIKAYCEYFHHISLVSTSF